MPHPYALVPASRPPSFFSVYSRPGTPERQTPEDPPQPNRRPPTMELIPPVPPFPSNLPLGDVLPRYRTPATKEGSWTAGHYVKHSSRVTLLLSGQEARAEMSAYSTGDTIEGILAVARPSGVYALEVKVVGAIHVDEIGGSGSKTVTVLDEMVYSWIPSHNGPFPTRASFRYTLPRTYLDPGTSSRYPLPPTYQARLDGIPGFCVDISYAIVVNLTQQRKAASLWRGVTNLRVPFRYTHRTRPALAGPFPSLLHKADGQPRTLFAFHMRPWRSGGTGIKVHLYLPASQVCSAQEPIPFHVSLLADELALAPFAEYRPPAASFLSLTGSASGSASNSSRESLGRTPRATRRCPLRVRVQRTTIVGSRGAGPASRLPGEHSEKSHMYSKEWIGQGVVHDARTSVNAVVWSGAIIIPLSAVGAGHGGFEVDGLKVMDSIVFSIESPPGCKPRYITLSETIPLQLTSDSFGCEVAIPVQPLG